MAESAVLREISGHVIWHTRDRRGAGVILRMAPVAIRRQRSRVIIRVASGTWDRRMRASERKRSGIVVECCVQPGGGCVALRAIL